MSKRPRDRRAADLNDLALWHHTAGSVTPLRKAKPRVPDVDTPAAPQPKARQPSVKTTPPTASPPRPAAKSSPAPIKATTPKPVPPLVPIERRKTRKIARGHIEIDARIDLHGLRQAEAERRLRAFLLDSRSQGFKTVLVITGKGAERETGGRHHDPERSERGVLRRSVPMWLEQPELRACVAGIAPAHIRHGGNGALYIHLRKPTRGRS